MEIVFGQIRAVGSAALAAWAVRNMPPEVLSVLPENWADVVVTIAAAAPFAAWSWWSKRPNK